MSVDLFQRDLYNENAKSIVIMERDYRDECE
jgi:hypothetical protein